MITEDYVSFETAKLLKERGFDEDVDLWYDENGEMFSRHKYDIGHDWRVKANQKVYECPTLQMAMKWLREKHNLHIEIDRMLNKGGGNWYSFYAFRVDLVVDPYDNLVEDEFTEYKTYEEAAEAAIKYCLENLI